MSYHQISTCRFCKAASHEDRRPFMKYGRRHYACQPCYLEHKSLDDLADWQVGQFAYRLLEETGKLAEVKARLRSKACPTQSSAPATISGVRGLPRTALPLGRHGTRTLRAGR